MGTRSPVEARPPIPGALKCCLGGLPDQLDRCGDLNLAAALA